MRAARCPTCHDQFTDVRGQACAQGVPKVPGYTMGSNWDWVPCPDPWHVDQ